MPLFAFLNVSKYMNLARFPRIRFAHLPTPLEHLPNLSRALGGPEIWIKRDDCTGMSTGGNKTRKLEFLLGGGASSKAPTSCLTQGATQSNHARQTAACAAKMRIDCHILLEDRTGKTDHDYTDSGNVLLDHLHGASIERCAANPDMNGELAKVAARLKSEGRKPYLIPGGGSNPTGALGYVNAAMELIAQANDLGLRIDHVVHATGSAGTQAGLIAGLAGIRSGVPLLGISVRAPRERQEENVFNLACATAELCGRRARCGARMSSPTATTSARDTDSPRPAPSMPSKCSRGSRESCSIRCTPARAWRALWI